MKTQVGDNQSKAGDKVQLHHTLADWICKVEVKKTLKIIVLLFFLFQEPKHENLFTECKQICC